MLVWATRTLPEAAIRGLILLSLFVVVVVLQIGLSTALLALGLDNRLAFTLAGVGVLTVVLSLNWFLRAALVARARGREVARKRNDLPEGPCCLVLDGPVVEVFTTQGTLAAPVPARTATVTITVRGSDAMVFPLR